MGASRGPPGSHLLCRPQHTNNHVEATRVSLRVVVGCMSSDPPWRETCNSNTTSNERSQITQLERQRHNNRTLPEASTADTAALASHASTPDVSSTTTAGAGPLPSGWGKTAAARLRGRGWLRLLRRVHRATRHTRGPAVLCRPQHKDDHVGRSSPSPARQVAIPRCCVCHGVVDGV